MNFASNQSLPMEKTFNNPEFSDVQVRVGRKTYNVAKYVLCVNSDVFRAYFRNDTIEKKSGIIEIKDLDPTLVGQMLRHMYGIPIENLKEIAHDLFVVAEKYNVQDLMKLCLDSMLENIDQESLQNCLELSFQMDLPELQQRSIEFAVNQLINGGDNVNGGDNSQDEEDEEDPLAQFRDLFRQNEEIPCQMIYQLLAELKERDKDVKIYKAQAKYFESGRDRYQQELNDLLRTHTKIAPGANNNDQQVQQKWANILERVRAADNERINQALKLRHRIGVNEGNLAQERRREQVMDTNLARKRRREQAAIERRNVLRLQLINNSGNDAEFQRIQALLQQSNKNIQIEPIHIVDGVAVNNEEGYEVIDLDNE